MSSVEITGERSFRASFASEGGLLSGVYSDKNGLVPVGSLCKFVGAFLKRLFECVEASILAGIALRRLSFIPRLFPSPATLLPLEEVSKTKQPPEASIGGNPHGEDQPASSSHQLLERGEELASRQKTPESTRNLLLGIALNLIAIPMCGAAFVFAPREAFVSTATSLLIALVVFVSMQFRVIQQRNGTFALMALGLVLTLIVPLSVSFCSSGAEWVRVLVDAKRAKGVVQNAAEHEWAASNPAARPASGDPLASKAAVASQNVALASAQTINEPKAEAPVDPQDLKGTVARSDRGVKGSDSPAEDPTRPEESSAERVTRLSKDEALRRYPGLASPGTPEHARYLEAYNEFARLRKFEFFKDPKWPLNLAELVALKEGWTRADLGQSERPGSERTPEPQSPRPTTVAPLVAVAPKTLTAPQPSGGTQAAAPAASTNKSLPGDGLSLEIPAVDASDPNAKAVNQSMIEVRRRYPAVGQDGTPENRAYLAAYKELERLRPDFFENPQWPLKLADLVAKSEGWRR